MRIIAVLILGGLMTSCAQDQGEQAAAVSQATEANAGGAAQQTRLCGLFTPAEMERYVGLPMHEGAPSTGGCQWVATNDEGDAIVQVIPASFHNVPRDAPGFKLLPTVGREGFVARYLDGWQAGAIVGGEAVRVTLAGPAASETLAAALLPETVKRLAK